MRQNKIKETNETNRETETEGGKRERWRQSKIKETEKDKQINAEIGRESLIL